MLQNYSSSEIESNGDQEVALGRSNWWMLLIIPSWVLVSFYIAQNIIVAVLWLLSIFNAPIESYNQTILNTIVASLVYVLTLAIAILMPFLTKKHTTSRKDLGLTRLPVWTDIFLTPAGLVVYLIFSSLLILLATRVLPGFDVNQVQSTGFGQLSQRYEYILAFVALVVVAPVAEEILFRGYLYGKLKKFVPTWVAIIATSILFGAAHGAWNVAIDTFALGIMLCLLRELTGSLWSSILLHMAKNSIAFYMLFIYPSLLTTLVR